MAEIKSTKTVELPLNRVLERNIKALNRAKRQTESDLNIHQRLVAALVALISSMGFFYTHAILVLGWVVVHWGLFGARKVATLSFDQLAGIAAIEAIFLSTLVLINQRLMSALVETREDLDLQMNLIIEHEITRILNVVDLIAREMRINTEAKVADLKDSKKDISPEMVMERIEDLKERARQSSAGVDGV